MSQIICTINDGNETIELVLDQVDPDVESSVWSAVLQDEDKPLQTEYFEMENDAEALDIIAEAALTIQNGIQ